MRRLFTTKQFYADGGTRADLRRGVAQGLWRKIDFGVFIEGAEEPTAFQATLARFVAMGSEVWGTAAGQLHGFDAMDDWPHATPVRRRVELLDPIVMVDGLRCTSPLQAIIDIAEFVDDLVWEQAFESGLHQGHFTVEQVEALLPRLTKSRRHGSPVIHRVLAQRPPGAPPTESLLETLMVQLARSIGVPPPTRQLRVTNRHGEFVARVDLCWPEFGVFLELDGEQHKKQPKYDAWRQTQVVAATGWLPGRFTWSQVRYNPKPTGRLLLGLLEQGANRSVAQLVATT